MHTPLLNELQLTCNLFCCAMSILIKHVKCTQHRSMSCSSPAFKIDVQLDYIKSVVASRALPAHEKIPTFLVTQAFDYDPCFLHAHKPAHACVTASCSLLPFTTLKNLHILAHTDRARIQVRGRVRGHSWLCERKPVVRDHDEPGPKTGMAVVGTYKGECRKGGGTCCFLKGHNARGLLPPVRGVVKNCWLAQAFLQSWCTCQSSNFGTSVYDACTNFCVMRGISVVTTLVITRSWRWLQS
jgi:hypothetical protein